MPYSTAHWRRFLGAIGRDDIADDESVTCPTRRSRNIELLYRLIAEVAPDRSTAQRLSVLREQEVPCAEVNRPDMLLDHPHLEDVGLFQSIEHPNEGRVPGMRSPFGVADARRVPDRPPPALGRDGSAVLREAGYTDAEIEAIAEAGGVRLP